MKIRHLIVMCCWVVPAAAWAEPASIVGTKPTRLQTASRADCAPVYMHSDGTYELGISWRFGGVVAPDWGSFAEPFEGPMSVCAFVADLTLDTDVWEDGQTADFFIWDNAITPHGDRPGTVLAALPDVSPWPIAFWPAITRVVAPLPQPVNVNSGKWWVGIWGNWPDEANPWYLAADSNGPSTYGPMTKSLEAFPPGWQALSVDFGTIAAIGLGVEAVPLTPAGVPTPGFVASTFGRVKSLYR